MCTGIKRWCTIQSKWYCHGSEPCAGVMDNNPLSSIHSSFHCCYPVYQSCPALCNPIDCSTLDCPSPSTRACSNSCALSQWRHPTISSSVVPFSSCLQSLPASGSFLMSHLRITWLKYWSFSINPSNEYSGLISFRMDWLDLLAVQGTLKSLLQHHSSKALVLWCSALLIVHPVVTGKNTALTIQTFLAKWCLCFLTCWLGLS